MLGACDGTTGTDVLLTRTITLGALQCFRRCLSASALIALATPFQPFTVSPSTHLPLELEFLRRAVNRQRCKANTSFTAPRRPLGLGVFALDEDRDIPLCHARRMARPVYERLRVRWRSCSTGAGRNGA
jgi:hypothetical protein